MTSTILLVLKISIMIKSLLIAGLGGFIGTISRFLISRYVQITYVSSFPWGTFLVNIAGSFLIGILFGITEKGGFMSHEWRIFLTVGICGGFTTFSSFTNEAFMLLQSKELIRLAGYSSLSVFFGIAAVFLGRSIIKVI